MSGGTRIFQVFIYILIMIQIMLSTLPLEISNSFSVLLHGNPEEAEKPLNPESKVISANCEEWSKLMGLELEQLQKKNAAHGVLAYIQVNNLSKDNVLVQAYGKDI
ncbi:hypothetical protein DUI87_08795 [Hirundo rustica rustica]|uniref:Uncharacterized protein n=1 Tax=Hirundo rustica rustica TaxID=333673 RepID=A0A3M0KKX0_HIRRU|nr:hypothetical protein DUI87_08795 [Hirundo rustica rustica]